MGPEIICLGPDSLGSLDEEAEGKLVRLGLVLPTLQPLLLGPGYQSI